jgi:hypothetical protein
MESGMPEMAPPVPPKFVMPDSLCWRKILILLLSATHQGICQSTMVALSYPDCSYFINCFSGITFAVFPCMYALTSTITLRGAMDANAKLPSIGNFGPWKGKYLYKNEMTYVAIAKKIGTIPADMGPKDLKWKKASTNQELGKQYAIQAASSKQHTHTHGLIFTRRRACFAGLLQTTRGQTLRNITAC